MLWTLVALGLAVTPWLNQLARHAGRSDLGSDANTVIYGLVAVSAATVGAVLAGRRARHPVGWLLVALGLWFTYGYAIWVLLAWRGAPPAAGLAVLDANVVAIPALIGFVLLLTPTGSLPSPRWRWWARVAAAAPLLGLVSLAVGPFGGPDQSVANPLAVAALAGPLLRVRTVAFVVAGLAIPVGAASLVVRFRRARGVERQQLRWLAVGAAPVAVAVAALAVQALAGNKINLNWLPGVCLAILPLAIGAAIVRYRLYDLDRIISRTVTYGLLTMLLGLGYAGVVLGLGRLLPKAPISWWLGRPWRWRRCSSRPPPHPGLGGSAVQPAPLRHRPDGRHVQRPPAPGDRPGHANWRAASGGRADHAADPDVAMAAAARSDQSPGTSSSPVAICRPTSRGRASATAIALMNRDRKGMTSMSGTITTTSASGL